MVLSSLAASSSVAASKAWPNASALPQRWMLATASRASTGVRSWNSKPSRSRNVQVRPSADTSCPASICGCGTPAASSANRVS